MINAPKIESLKIYELFILLETRKFNILESTKPYLVSREISFVFLVFWA